ncbi:hypothetical protein C0995_005827 [Termitomyces sp. Mi166|nr:hypothetical protein C0995_005827 [Termitomyces sp. Mi166\
MASPSPTKNTHSATESTPLLSTDTDGRADADIDTSKNDVHISTKTIFYQELFTIPRYALPIFSSQLLEFSIVLVPVVSLGHLSTTSLAAVSLGSMTANVTGFSILQGLASALDTVLPSAWTSTEPRLVGLWAQRMAVIMAFALVPIFFVWFNAEPILLAIKQDPEVARLAALYLRWYSFSLPAFAFNCISRRYFQSQGHFYIQTRIVCIAAPFNMLINYLLVWGPPPIRLGFIGAPIASALTLHLISLTSLIHGTYLIPRTAWHPLTMKMLTHLGILVRLGLSGVGQLATEWWAWELVALAASFFGPTALAAQSILISTSAMVFQLGYAIANATSIRIGNLLGEKNARRAEVAAKTSLVVVLVASFLTSSMLLASRHSWARMFNNDAAVVGLVSGVLPLIALYQVVDGNSVVTAGILRARGQQFVGAVLNITAYYIGMPIAYWLGFNRHLGLGGLWIGYIVALAYCAIIGTVLCFMTDWKEEVLKVERRLAQERLRQVDHDV